MVSKIKTTRWQKTFVLQVFARNSTKIEYPKSQKDYPSRQSDVETTSKQRQSMSSNRRRKVVENANGIDVERSTLFRRTVIDVASPSEYRRRFHDTFLTSYQRRITVENANGIDVEMSTSF